VTTSGGEVTRIDPAWTGSDPYLTIPDDYSYDPQQVTLEYDTDCNTLQIANTRAQNTASMGRKLLIFNSFTSQRLIF
jgi:hypothetical protein